MYFPIWVDLKGQDSVPETVHHVVGVVIVAMVTVLSWLLWLQVCNVDPITDTSWQSLKACVKVCNSAPLFDHAPLCATPSQTDGIHVKDRTGAGNRSQGVIN